MNIPLKVAPWECSWKHSLLEISDSSFLTQKFLSPWPWMPHFQEGHKISWVSEREQCTSCILSVSKWHMLSSFHFSISVLYKHSQSCSLLWLSWVNACISTCPQNLIVNYSTTMKMANAWTGRLDHINVSALLFWLHRPGEDPSEARRDKICHKNMSFLVCPGISRKHTYILNVLRNTS